MSTDPNVTPTPGAKSRMRQPLLRDDSDSDKEDGEMSDVLDTLGSSSFINIVVTLLTKGHPGVSVAIATPEIDAFFNQELIATLQCIGRLQLDDLPSSNLVPTTPLSFWTVKVVKSFFTALITICANGIYPSTDWDAKKIYSTCKSLSPPNPSGRTTSPSPTSTTLSGHVKKYDLRHISSINLDPFDGNPLGFLEWSRNVENCLGKYGCSDFLTDSSLGVTATDATQSILYTFYDALNKGIMKNFAAKNKHLTSVADFFSALKAECDQPSTRVAYLAQEWSKLFKLRLSHVDDIGSYVNSFSLAQVDIKNAKCAAITEESLLKAIINLTVDCEEVLNLIASADMDNKPTSEVLQYMLDYSRKKQARSEATTGERTFRRANTTTTNSSTTGSGSAISNFPTFPKAWIDVLGDAVYNSLCAWRNTVLKNFHKLSNPEITKKISSWVLRGSLPTSSDTKSPNPKSPHNPSKNKRKFGDMSTSDIEKAKKLRRAASSFLSEYDSFFASGDEADGNISGQDS
jgi:hypothetical protein